MGSITLTFIDIFGRKYPWIMQELSHKSPCKFFQIWTEKSDFENHKMFLLSKFFPKLLKPDKRHEGDKDSAQSHDKPKDYQCKILFLDDTELNLSLKVIFTF